MVLGANLGIAVGVAAIPAQSISVFMRALQADFGWTRADISFGPTILVGVLALVSPLLGWVTDRVRTTWICVIGLVALAISLLLFSRIGPDVRLYYAGCAAIAIVASGAGTVPYARAVSASFVRGRGLALGIAMVGTGISMMLVPVLLAPYAARVGWRQGYVTLALIVALATPVVGILMSHAPPVAKRDAPDQERRGIPFHVALRGRTFWTLAASFFLIPLSLGGMQLHLLSFLADGGVKPGTAGLIAGITGLVQIISRLLSGWLVDHIFAPRLAATIMTMAAICMAGLALFGAPAAALGPIAFGLAMGAEIDLVGYLTARYFGMRAYGRIYGLLYAACLVGASSSLVFYGAIFDSAKSYAPALYAASCMLFVSALLFLTLRRFDPLIE